MVEQRGHSLEEAQQRLAAARNWRERAPAADRIFHNDGTQAEFEAAVDDAIAEAMEQFRAGTLPEPRWRALQRGG
jgi:dephospho-CoA kinase